MALRRIVREGDSVLRKKCRPVTEFNKRLCVLLDDMAQTMYDAQGAGLAAPQVGILRRVVVIDVADELHELINPEIIFEEGVQGSREGCLSIPNFRGYVERPHKVVVRAQRRNGKRFELVAEGMLAIAVCHELDHLDGILMRERVVPEPIDFEEEDE